MRSFGIFRFMLTALSLAALLILLAMPAGAALLTTDAASYDGGDVVYVTFLNDTAGEIFTNTSPPLGIRHVDTDTWVLFPGGLPEVITLDPGEFLEFSYDTGGSTPDPIGTYEARIQYGDITAEWKYAIAQYTLLTTIKTTDTMWSQVKALYR
jgi:hypothetical protein